MRLIVFDGQLRYARVSDDNRMHLIIGRSAMHILDTTHDQFVDAFHRRYGLGAHVSTPIYRRVMKTGRTVFDGMAIVDRYPELAGRLSVDLELSTGRLVEQQVDAGVIKFVTRLTDDLDIESVVIPMHQRHTLCVSSQVGCRMGCRFCRTGRMGLIRNLTPAEIVGQVFMVRHQLGIDVRNVVFMGMGEPLDNLDNVLQAIRVLEDQRGMDIARRYITVSTVGLTAGIDRLGRIDGTAVNLAISLNAPSDDIRAAIMPINHSNSMSALRASLSRYPLGRKGSFFMEYVLIRDVNDQEKHARALARYLSGMAVKLNLIAFNPFSGSDLKAPSVEAYERFHGWLLDEGVFVRRRGQKGGRIMAACGQLGGKNN
jgi:23S rRNA (adenine2503-C2)-methyltransferase